MNVPWRLNDTTSYPDNLAYLNQDFDSVVTSLEDFDPQLGVASGSFTVAAGKIFYVNVDTLKSGPWLQDAVLYDPKFTFYVDAFDSAHIVPDGISLTSGQKALFFSIINLLTPFTGDLATAIALIRNADSASHTIYFDASVKIYPKPPTNTFR